MYPTFNSFLNKNWWFLLLALAKAFNNSEEALITGSIFFDVIVLMGGLLIIMYVYWLIRYSKNVPSQSNTRPSNMPRWKWNEAHWKNRFKK